MIEPGQDWKELCRRYRLLHGLKQEAMAQDFRVDQSTVSRWERGTREPSMAAKHTILNELLREGSVGPDRGLQMMLERSNSAVAVWDQAGILRGASPRFQEEMITVNGDATPVGQPAHILTGGSNILDIAINALNDLGFFRGEIMVANFAFAPFVNPARHAVGGMNSVSVFPVALGGGEFGMLGLYSHDVLDEKPLAPGILLVDWVNTVTGISGQRVLRHSSN